MKRKTPAQAPKTFGAMVRLVRENRQISQKTIAKKADITGKYLSRIELGHVDPSLSVVIRIAEALETSLDELVGRASTHSSLELRVRIPINLPGDERRLNRIMKAASV